MSVSDATYTATCDKCQDEEVITPEVFHRDYSGKTQIVCMDDGSIADELEKIGWKMAEDGTCECDNCRPEEDDETEDEA